MSNEPNGLRYNKEKPPMHLLPWDALVALALHYRDGAKKYPERNWELGLKWNEGCAASLARHLASWSSGEDVDAEGSYHDVSMAWNAIALVAFRLRASGTDDRPTKKVVKSVILPRPDPTLHPVQESLAGKLNHDLGQ